MNCEHFEELISDYLEGRLPAADRDAFEQHKASCMDCPGLLADVQQAITLCRAVPETAPPKHLAERILNATLGERRGFSLAGFFAPANLKRFLNPQFAVGLALVLCVFGLVTRMVGSDKSGEGGTPQAVLTKLDIYTHKIYSEGVKLYNAKNEIVAEYNYLKTSLFNQIDYQFSQITGQIKEPVEKPAPAQPKTPPKDDKKSSLLDFFVRTRKLAADELQTALKET